MVHFAKEGGAADAAHDLTTWAQARGLFADVERAAELERLGDSIAELTAHLHAATYRLLVMIAEFDRRGGWGGGFRSCAHWLSWRTRINLGAAREKVRVARALERLPLLSDALRRGEFSYAVVRAVTRVATPANEAELVELARHGTASHVERVVRAWRRVDRLEEQWAERERHRARALHLYPDEDGMYVVRGRLSPEVGALLDRALAAAGDALYPRGKTADAPGSQIPSYAQRMADAVGLLAEWALVRQPTLQQPAEENAGVDLREDTEAAARDATATIASQEDGIDWGEHTEAATDEPTESTASSSDDVAHTGAAIPQPTAEGEAPPRVTSAPARVASRNHPRTIGRAERFQVVVHVDAEVLRAGSDSGQAVLAGGVRVSAETSRRIACDASRVVMIHDRDGNALSVGRRARTVPAAIRRALDHRDRGCRFPGCGLRICDAHHIEHWADGGGTNLTNLVLLCRRHHRLVHEEGYGMQQSPTGEITFTRPDGRPLPDAPAPAQLSADLPEQLGASHRDMGIAIDAWTPTPDWHGERLDLDFAIRALRTL